LLLVALIAGCGGDASDSPQARAAVAGGTLGGLTQGAKAVEVLIDHTTARSSDAIAEGYVGATAQAVDPLLLNGGHITVSVVAAAGVAPVRIIDEDVADSESLAGRTRENFVLGARAQIRTQVAQALGLAPLPPGSKIKDAIAAMPSSGSDLAGAIGASVEAVGRRGGGVVVGLSDGLQRTGEIDFSVQWRELTHSAGAASIRPLMPADAAGVAIVLRGIGLSGNKGQVSTPRSKWAVQVWSMACRRAGADDCDVSAAL